MYYSAHKTIPYMYSLCSHKYAYNLSGIPEEAQYVHSTVELLAMHSSLLKYIEICVFCFSDYGVHVRQGHVLLFSCGILNLMHVWCSHTCIKCLSVSVYLFGVV